MAPSNDRQADAVVIEPLTVRISTAVQLTGISRSRLYELIQSGELETVKVGRSTLIPYKSLKALTGV
jgi:excisionase family DNA binding protein